jgi:ribosome biogenesis GTPase / thiamine phosphate phosphatase
MTNHDDENEPRQRGAQKKGRETQDEQRARKAAAKEKKNIAGRSTARPRVSEENWDTLLDRYGHLDKRRVPGAQKNVAEEEVLPVSAEEVAASGIVISVSSGRCRVFRDETELDVTVPSEIAVKQKSRLAVGDRVVVREENGAQRLIRVLPRTSVLARPDPLHKHVQRLVAANIDVVVNVVSVKSPPLRPRLIDRYLIAIQRGGALPVICVNKLDLLEGAARTEEMEKLDVYRALGVPVIACSTHSGEGLDEMRAILETRTSALVGHSGVGKSSILNALDTRLQLAIGDVSTKRGTGRHTTTSSTLIDFGGGTFIIDTPGIREFGLWNLDRESLRDYFPEFEEPAEFCRFTNCSHVHEPNCEVKEKVESGDIDRARYETYVRLWEEVV